MSKKLSEELRHCLEQDGCSKCSCFETKSVLTCPGLLQKAYEVAKWREGMYDIMRPLAERLNEYTSLEEQGKLLKLPCAVGDVVYVIIDNSITEETDYVILELIVDDVSSKKIFYGCDGAEDYIEEIGKTVFLTKPEAEQALKEMEGKK